MKKFILVLTFIVFTNNSQAAFGRIAVEKQRRVEAEQKLSVQQQQTEKFRNTTTALGISCVLMLVLGTAIGSKGRKDVQK